MADATCPKCDGDLTLTSHELRQLADQVECAEDVQRKYNRLLMWVAVATSMDRDAKISVAQSHTLIVALEEQTKAGNVTWKINWPDLNVEVCGEPLSKFISRL